MGPKSQLPDINLKELAALCSQTPDGLIVEVGVYKGGSAWALNEVALGRKIHLYDTFCGIPEESPGDVIKMGGFHDADLAAVMAALPDAEVHVGIFPATLGDDIQNIAFVHVDCDQQKTCRSAIELLWPRVVPGGIMAFDDYPFDGIKRAIHDNFIVVHFTECKIPYVIKEIK